jgi:hypothetical protein
MPTRPGSVFSKLPCNLCKKLIPINGLAQHNHRMKHIREGLLSPSDLERAQLNRAEDRRNASRN